MKNPRFPLGAALLAALAPSATSQDLVPLVVVGDVFPGQAPVTQVFKAAVNDDGEWVVWARTFDGASLHDLVLKNGAVFLEDGSPLPAPPGASILGFDSITLNDASHSGWNFLLSGTSGSNDNSGVYFDTTLVMQEGTVSTAPQFDPGTTYGGFSEIKINDANEILAVCFTQGPSTDGRAMVIFELDGAGDLLSEEVLYKRGDVLPGQTESIVEIETTPNGTALNAQGQTLFGARLSDSKDVVYLDSVMLAEEGAPSPVPGRSWGNLAGIELDLNDQGEFVYKGRLDGDSTTWYLIVENGAKFVQEGDALPAFAPFSLSSIPIASPVRIGNDGSIYWFGVWDDPDSSRNRGLFRNHELLIQQGVTTANGLLVESLFGAERDLHVSSDGRYVCARVFLEGGSAAWVLVDTATLPGPYCFGDGSGTPCPCGNEASAQTGCANSSGAGAQLAVNGSPSVGADDLALEATGLLPNRPALLFAGRDVIDGGDGKTFGDGLRCAGGLQIRLGVELPDAGGLATWGPGLGADGGWLPGDRRSLQVWYRDPSGPCGSTFNLSNGYTIEFQP